METFITGQIFKGITEGDVLKVLAYALIFIFLWLEIKSIKSTLRSINQNVLKSHGSIRREQKAMTQRIVVLEKASKQNQTFNTAKGGLQL